MKTKDHLMANNHPGISLASLEGDKCGLKLFSVAMIWGVLSLAQVQADALTGLYTQVALGDPDFYGGANAGGPLAHGLVQSQLGPDGLPVLSATGISRLGTSSDMNATTHELLWWSAGADPYVSPDQIPVNIDSMPLNFGYPLQNWYPTGQTSDQSFFRTVHWEGTFNLASAGSLSLFLQTDDDGWLFIDGTLTTEYHYGDATAPVNTTASAGLHRIDLFYDDRAPTLDQVIFSASVPLSPVPEPGPVAVSILGLGVLMARSRQGRRQPAANNHRPPSA